MWKRWALCGLTLILLVGAVPQRAEAVSTSAGAAILVDADSGRVLYEQNADARMGIASTTKILTALVALRDGTLREQVEVSAEAAGTEGSSMYLKAGETLRLETLLYGLLLCSGNDAAIAIAQHVGGSVEGFVERMNETARELGMVHSSFANPNGLDHQDHYSTARDMAILARAAMENETLVRIASTRRISIDGRLMTNHNKLLSRTEGCLGLKTGYTRASGRTLVTCAERGGQRLIAVTLQDGNDWSDHERLYDYGFSRFPRHRAAVRGEELMTAPVFGGTENRIPLVAGESFSWPLQEGERLEMRTQLPELLMAPLPAGTVVGQAIFTLRGQEVGRVDLLSGAEVLPLLQSAVGPALLKLPE